MQFKKFKQTAHRVLYRRNGSTKSVRMDAREFEGGTAPDVLDIGDASVKFAAASAGASSVPMPADVAEAKAKLDAFRKAQKDAREARLTPEQRAKREQKVRENKAAKAATKTAPPQKATPQAPQKVAAR